MNGMLEAKCGLCGETFNPVDENDLMHMEKEDGTACEGTGELVAEYKTMRGTAKKSAATEQDYLAGVTKAARLKAGDHVYTPGRSWVEIGKPVVVNGYVKLYDTAGNYLGQRKVGTDVNYFSAQRIAKRNAKVASSKKKVTITSSQRKRRVTITNYRKFTNRPTISVVANVRHSDDDAIVEYMVYFDAWNKTHRMFLEIYPADAYFTEPDSLEEILPGNASTWTLAGAVMHIAQLLQEASKY